MDNSGNNNNNTNSSDTSELSKITQEIYKKSFELAEKNKTLSILQKIDEIILSSVTDIKQVTQQVVDITAREADFKAIAIYLVDKENNSLNCLAVSQTDYLLQLQIKLNKDLYTEILELNNETNPVSRSLTEKHMQVVNNLQDILLPHISAEEITAIAELKEIKSSIIFPLTVREETIGVIVFNIAEEEVALSTNSKELMNRLVDVIGIALDNSLLYQRIEKANKKLEELDKMKDEFLSVASHELRTPLTAIRGNSALLRDYYIDKLDDTNFKEMVTDINEGSVMLIGIVNDFLDMSRLESGKMQFAISSISLPPIIAKVSEELTNLVSTKGIELHFDQPNAQTPNVLADPNKCKQVVYNLVGNAIKFTDKGQVKIFIEQHENMLKVLVQDTGIGIEKEKQQLLFQKFQQVGQSPLIKQVSVGSGLGLYISKLIIESMGGQIKLESSELDKDSLFSFTLPIAKTT